MKSKETIFSKKVLIILFTAMILYGMSATRSPALYAADDTDTQESSPAPAEKPHFWLDDEDDYFYEWEPREEMTRMQRQMGKMFRNMVRHGFSRSWPDDSGGGLDPAIDIKETEKEYIIQLDLPGMDKGKIDVTVADNVLTVQGEREIEEQEAEEDAEGAYKYYRRERRFGTFQRRIPLPDNAETDTVVAKYDNGVLTITVPKKGEEKIPKKEKVIHVL